MLLVCAIGWKLKQTDKAVAPSAEDARLAVRLALRRGDPQVAQELAEQILDGSPDDAEALLLRAMASAELKEFEAAVADCLRVSASAGSLYVDARCMAANLYANHLGDLRSAEAVLHDALAADEESPAGLQQMGRLLSWQTRTWELIPVQLRLVRQGAVSLPLLLSIAQGALLYPDVALLDRFEQVTPDLAGLKLARARLALLNQEASTAESLLRQAILSDPNLGEAHARLGTLRAEQGRLPELLEWAGRLPESARLHPDTWIALGQLEELRLDSVAAADCYREAGLREGASLSANYLLGRKLAELGQADASRRFLTRAEQLERYRKLFDHPPGVAPQLSEDNLRQGLELAETLGLPYESLVLARLLMQLTPQDEALGRRVVELQEQVARSSLERTSREANPFHEVELPIPGASGGALPEMTERSSKHGVAGAKESTDPSQSTTGPTFEDVAGRAGLDFEYDNGVSREISGAQRPYDFTGGGIAVTDFDGDGWPDLFFSQGCTLDDATGQPVRGQPDRLYRNLAGERFADATPAALPPDLDYSQGVAAGDVNNDGFADLLVANLGSNRLLLNLGDGTFADATPAVAADAGLWTTSCVIADFNGDGFADLYTVNYLSGDITSRVCRDQTGRLASCAPQDFAAAQDQLHLSDGAGLFVDATARSGVLQDNGKGLGVVAADLDRDHRLDLFVANDGVPNALFLNRTEQMSISFESVAMQRGVAVNGRGLSEACMGIVAEDFDGDSHLDLFVTNFFDETNTVYAATELPGFFDDRTPRLSWTGSSRSSLGFGVQALDGELDGAPDLIIANGHVDDFRDRGVPYQMVPQYFRNLGGFHFEELRTDSVGPYFGRDTLGRAVARFDWNRDGLDDAVVGTLDGPVALLQNTTREPGTYVAVDLSAVKTARDAIGSVVRVTRADGLTVRRQLVAGDGYQASNERVLRFGLGPSTTAVDIQIQWPGGAVAEYHNVPVNRRYRAVEGARELSPH